MEITNVNRYNPYYDQDENRTIMSIDNKGSWVHIKDVEKLQKLLKMAEDEAVASDDHGRKQENRADALEAENEELKENILTIQQVSGILCDKCGWAMKFPEELCRCELEQYVKMLRDALDQMDIFICAAGDLMTKEDMQEAERLSALRDAVLTATKD